MSFIEKEETVKNKRENIPGNDIAKVMHYLYCVCHCIDYEDIDEYTNPSNWASLSSEDIQFLFFLALNLSPDLFIGKVFFPSSKLCFDLKQRFHKIGVIHPSAMIVSSLNITGHTCQVRRVFIFKETWLNEYYLDPMNRLSQRFHSTKSKSNKFCSIY